MRLMFAELRKVWGQRVFSLCLAVLAGANLFLACRPRRSRRL